MLIEKSKSSRETKGDQSGDAFGLLVPLDRAGHPKDIASTAVYLASDASSYVTGTIVLVDGGSSLTMPNFTIASPEFVKQWKAPVRAKM